MIVAEGKCRQFKNNDIAFSPIVGKWIKRLNLFRWIKGYKNGGKVNKSNLVQTCMKTANVNYPDTYSLDEVMVEEHACLSFLEELRATAPYLRLQHLRGCLAKAKRRNDKKAVKAITRILKREHDIKKYGRLRGAFGKPRALPAMQIEVPNANGPNEIHSTKEAVESVRAEFLGTRFKTAHGPRPLDTVNSLRT